jgi:hypothetical protein
MRRKETRKIPMANRPTMTKEQYEAWATRAGSRVIGLSAMKSMTVTGDGKKQAIYTFGEIIKINPDGQGTTIQLGKTGPAIKEGLVGMAGAYLDPSLVGATSCEQVIDSWNWLFDQFKHDKKDLEEHIEGVHILTFITSGVYDTVLNRTMTLAVHLKALHDSGMDVSQKISELDKKIRGNMKASNWWKQKDSTESMIRLRTMTDQMSDMLSESEIALFAVKTGMKVVLGRSPDLMIEGVRVEVKHFRTQRIDEGALSNKIAEGLSQGGEVIAISSLNLRPKRLRDMKVKWLPAGTLPDALIFAVATAKNGRKCVLLYSSTNRGPIAKVGLLKNGKRNMQLQI